MRRQLVLSFILLFATAALATAQEASPTPIEEPEGLPLLIPPDDMISGEWQPVMLEEIAAPFAPDSFLPAGDSCSLATSIIMPVNGEDGGQTVVNNFSSNPNDPNLNSCMWGSPSRPQGYRSAWYRFAAPATGWLTVDTGDSDYDTVVAIFAGSCAGLALVACNDDHVAFTSLAKAWVIQGQTYFIEVVDWQLAVSGTATLRLVAGIESVSEWNKIGTLDPGPARSRHAAVTYGPYVHIIGGQTLIEDNAVRTGTAYRYNTVTGTWEHTGNMPFSCGGGGPNGEHGGYSNTTAAYVDGRIYIPSGYVGDPTIYQGNHCVYDTIHHNWLPHPFPDPGFEPAPVPWPDGQPFAYAEAVAYHAAGYYLTGGLTGRAVPVPGGYDHGQPRNNLFFYTVATNSWAARAPMQTGRYAHVAGLQRVGNQEFVCVAGGIGANIEGDPILLSGGECYNVATNTWAPMAGSLNIPRYNAGSAVGPDGRWYVFGGTNNAGASVAMTEVYNPVSQTWTALDSRHDLTNPPRAWARGGFVGGALWVTGGHWNSASGDLVINLIERLFLHSPGGYYIPIVFGPPGGPVDPGTSFASALPLAFYQPRDQAFTHPKDFFHTYYFDVMPSTVVTVRLTQIPSGSDYDLHVYEQNKGRLVSGRNLGNLDELLTLELAPGRYYVVVERILPPPGADPAPYPYRIEITN